MEAAGRGAPEDGGKEEEDEEGKPVSAYYHFDSRWGCGMCIGGGERFDWIGGGHGLDLFTDPRGGGAALDSLPPPKPIAALPLARPRLTNQPPFFPYHPHHHSGRKFANKWDSYDVDGELARLDAAEEHPHGSSEEGARGASSQERTGNHQRGKGKVTLGRVRTEVGQLNHDLERLMGYLDQVRWLCVAVADGVFVCIWLPLWVRSTLCVVPPPKKKHNHISPFASIPSNRSVATRRSRCGARRSCRRATPSLGPLTP